MQLNKPKKSIFCFNPFAKKNATLEKSDFFYDGKSSKKLRVFMKEIK